MPTYDYKCEACGHKFEKFQRMTAAPVRKCPKCGKNKVKRLIGTGAGMIFKGSGFYITDYRSENYKSAAKADSGGTSSETKTDSKDSTAAPAAKESKPAPASPPPPAPKERKSSEKKK